MKKMRGFRPSISEDRPPISSRPAVFPVRVKRSCMIHNSNFSYEQSARNRRNVPHDLHDSRAIRFPDMPRFRFPGIFLERNASGCS